MSFLSCEELEQRFIEVCSRKNWWHSITVVKEKAQNCVEVRFIEGNEPTFSSEDMNRLFLDFETIPPFRLVSKPRVRFNSKSFDWQERVGT